MDTHWMKFPEAQQPFPARYTDKVSYDGRNQNDTQQTNSKTNDW